MVDRWTVSLSGVTKEQLDGLEALAQAQATLSQNESDATVTFSPIESLDFKDGKVMLKLSRTMRRILTDDGKIFFELETE
tara:strand:+ start:2370 stop:2609 length:240 start_codon:yes stop_codon:yes gene_type:complete